MTNIECDSDDMLVIDNIADIYITNQNNNRQEVITHITTLALQFKKYMLGPRGFSKIKKGQLKGYLHIVLGDDTYLKLIVGGGKTITSLVFLDFLDDLEFHPFHLI